MPRSWWGVVIAAWSVALLLQLVAIDRQSLIGDAPYHLLAGEQALRYGQNSVNLEHPPLVKLLASLPLLVEKPLAPLIGVRGSLETSTAVFDDPARLDRVRHRSRWILFVAFAVPFGIACYALGTTIAGAACGALLSLFVLLSFSILPFLSVIQTDTAAALGFVLTLLAALAYVRRPTPWRAAAIGTALGLAIASKFSGVLLLPTVLVALWLANSRRFSLRLVDFGILALTAIALVYGTYKVANRAYNPELGRATITAYCHGQAMVVGDRMLPYERWLLAIERVSPEAAQWLTGLIGIRIQNEIGIYPSYAFGRIDSRGRWWYFPAVFLVKTPVIILLATIFAIVAWFRSGVTRGKSTRSTPPAAATLIVVTLVVYLGTAIASSYNLGVRHLIPVLPMLFLPAAMWVARSAARAATVAGLLLVESVVLAPLWMSVTNTWWLGTHNPTRFAFTDSNSDYMQNFVILDQEARRRNLEPLFVLYPPLPEKQIRAYAPQARLVTPETQLEPGWYAVNMRVGQLVPALLQGQPEAIYDYDVLHALAKHWEPVWRAITAGADRGYIAGTFHLYRVGGDPP